MYKLMIVDHNAEIEISSAKAPHPLRVPRVGEHLVLKFQGTTKVCEVEDVWTNISLDPGGKSVQGAVQVFVRWNRGLDPAIYVRRFR